MILDAAETVLGYFGFDRAIYGNKKNLSKRKWRWFEELRQERDINTEKGKTRDAQPHSKTKLSVKILNKI
jgi:hypothetical protein